MRKIMENITRRSVALVLAGSMVIGMCQISSLYSNKLASAEETVTDNSADTTQSLSVTMSKDSGVYTDAFSLSMESVGATKIYYTLDGSNPTSSDTRVEYTAPISITDRSGAANVLSAVDPVLFDAANNVANSAGDGFESSVSAPSDSDVDKSTIVKAASVDASGNYSSVATNTYFVGEITSHIQGIKESCEAAGVSLSVMSISMDYDDLFDSTKGIYVKGDIFNTELQNYLDSGKTIPSWNAADTARGFDANYKQRGREWERNAHIDYFETDGTTTSLKLQQDCGIRVQGNYSRSDYQKSFRLYARSDYGKKNFNYSFFDNATDASGNVLDKYKTLVLRNGGNCTFLAKYNDAYWQSLISELKCSTQASRVCAVYLDGEYWGIYVLQEDYSSSDFENRYGVNKDDVVSYKGDHETYDIGYKLDEGDLPEGVTDESYYLQDLISWFDKKQNLSTTAAYNEFTQMIDADSFCDYFAANCWMNNKWDWPGKNWTIWKTKNVDASNTYADGKWRLCFYDLDFGGVSGYSDISTNTIAEDNYKLYGLVDFDTVNPVALTFAYLMTNKSFRTKFKKELTALSSTTFEKTAALARLETYKDTYSPLYEQFFNRFSLEGSSNQGGSLEEAVDGTYGSYACIKTFLSKREDYIDNMVDWVDSAVAGSIKEYGITADGKPAKKTISTLKITAKKGQKSITVKTIKKAKVKVALSQKLIKIGKKNAKSTTISASKNTKGNVVIKLGSKLPKGVKVKVTVSKSGYKARTKTVKSK